MRRVRFRRGPRWLALAAALAVATLGVVFGGTPASALNHGDPNFRNAGAHQFCLEIRTEDPALGARAHLWTCTRPVPDEQQFLFLSFPAGEGIRVKRSPGYCLQAMGTGQTVRQWPCDGGSTGQNWVLKDTGEVVNAVDPNSPTSGQCLDALPADTKNAAVVTAPCNGSLSQRWFF
jgi:hypothetical protein